MKTYMTLNENWVYVGHISAEIRISQNYCDLEEELIDMLPDECLSGVTVGIIDDISDEIVNNSGKTRFGKDVYLVFRKGTFEKYKNLVKEFRNYLKRVEA